MPIEKTTFVTTSGGDRLNFSAADGGKLKVEIVRGGDVDDTATLDRDDLVALLREFFPQQRKPREKASAVAPANGSGRRLGRGLPRADMPIGAASAG
ncbi:hypothetical protein RHODGE_RHODGE_01004 [Rhodoplanes serenus]|uniref:Uncharacterized protein n=1 Tax=Rhodoplanes serenus TaxID=200615 RepID=A0A3S4BEE6_9BRAD|nr:hypothetical protein [Rhodoplanes serenus]VCU06605.1 hypothetical protein RHODPL_RHODPL_00054 [Rhodoplanes serenus]VCU07854.1 hypothetical protein RHODGE_RHODGE_01004 [Rhodoplanes serenus]